jgi:hypothetical protein
MQDPENDGTSRALLKVISPLRTKLHFKDTAYYMETILCYAKRLYFLFYVEAGFYVKSDLITSCNLQQIHGHSLLKPTRQDNRPFEQIRRTRREKIPVKIHAAAKEL